jgi:hypothetical protein
MLRLEPSNRPSLQFLLEASGAGKILKQATTVMSKAGEHLEFTAFQGE